MIAFLSFSSGVFLLGFFVGRQNPAKPQPCKACEERLLLLQMRH